MGFGITILHKLVRIIILKLKTKNAKQKNIFTDNFISILLMQL